MKKDQFFELAEKYSRNECSKKEIRLFESFYAEMQQNPKDWENWDLSNKEETRLSILQKINKQIDTSEKEVKYHLPERRKITWSIAASIALLISVGFGVYFYSGYQESTTVLSSADEIRSFTLPDGSSVTLNRFSSLNYAEGFGDGHRNLELDGEAFFDVERNETLPFIINTHGTQTKVLGTSFNVLSYDSSFTSVTVKTGEVQVSSGDQTMNILPNQEARMFDGKIVHTTLLNGHLNLAWMEGDLVIPSLPLDMALLRIAHFYDRELTTNQIVGDCEMRGRFDKNDSIQQILKGLTFTYQGFDYVLNERQLIVNNVECE